MKIIRCFPAAVFFILRMKHVKMLLFHEGEKVRLIIDSGKEEVISLEEYRGEVCKFADKIEAFYKNSLPKKIPEDEFDKNGYLAFWNEWHRRRNA